MRQYFGLLLVLLLCLSFSDNQNQQVQFMKADHVSEVFQKANETEKMVFLDFYNDQCVPCRLMDKKVFTDPKVASFMNNNFVNYKVNISTADGYELSKLYGIRALPTLLCLNETGHVMSYKEGYTWTGGVLEMGNLAISKNQENLKGAIR